METAARDPGYGGIRFLGAFRSRDFRLLWGGQTVSLIGNGAFFVAIGWRVTQLTGRASALPLVLMLYSVAQLTTLLVGGALADRHERRRLMILSDLVRCGVVGGLAVTDLSGGLTLPLALAFAVAVGLADGFFQPAFGGIVPLTVEADLLPSANALIGVSRNLTFIVGPAIAAGLYGLAGSGVVFAFDAGTFLVSAALLWLARPRAFEHEQHEGTWESIVDGARYVAGVPWLWLGIAVASFVLMVAMAPLQSLLPTLVERHFHRGVGSYGFLFTAQALGMLAGTLLYGQLTPRRARVPLIFGAFGANDLFAILFVLSGSYAAAALLMAGRGACIGFGIALWETTLMEEVPASKLSRVISLDYFGSTGLTPVGYALTAVLAPLLPLTPMLLVGFSVAFALWIVPLASRRVRVA